uniref:Uncharacterized protein n=1 Tax=Eimeria tenella TaxID=5802 RepID=H9B9X9_EIMTE|nr:hypothetical protein [Eimeria tenella]
MPAIGLYCTAAAIRASRLCRLDGSFLREGRGLLSGCRATERREACAFNQRCAEARAGSDASSAWGSANAGTLFQCRHVRRAFSTAPKLDDNTVTAMHGGDFERLRVARLLRRYQMLRPEDRMRLEHEHRREGGSFMGKWQELRAQGIDNQLQSWEAEKREREEQQERTLRLRDIYKPAHLRRRKRKVKRVQQSEEQAPPVVAANFTEEAQTLSLVEDAYKAEVYEEICARLSREWETRDHLSDSFVDILEEALRHDLMDQSRPTLVNEFTDFDNPYMLKRQALKRLLEERGTRNALDESMIDKYLDKRPDLLKLRLAAKLPPEVVEPLVAFHGITCYNFDKRTRLGQKVNAVLKAVNSVDCELDQVLQSLEENRRSDMIHEFHPFRNHFGFVSAIPTGTAGSILMGREESGTDKELRMIRYPTLQRVAHTLPKDAKYRAIVAHAIRVLERSRGWDFKDKLKAVSTLIEVYNHLPPSATYERKLDEAFPVLRKPGMTRQTKSRNSVFCRGLRYIRSLSTQKPLSMRLAKKK